MSRGSQFPRDYQIAEMMGDTECPLPALPRRHLKNIAELLVLAWTGLLETQREKLQILSEPEINALMDARINRLCQEQSLWSALIAGVVRGKESLSYDGRKLEIRPDLSIILTGYGRGLLFPLTVECKLIEKKKGVDLYCAKGLARYVQGDYAWYAQEAFMLAYVRDGSTIVSHLKPHLAANQAKAPDPFLTEQLPEPIKFPYYDLSHSRHGRKFGENPTLPIAVWHLWVS